MFERARKYSKCILCGSTDLSREHMFGDGLFQRLRSQLPWLISKPSKKDPGAINDGDALMGITMRCLCKMCNGRLGEEMRPVYPILLALITGSARGIERDERRYLVRYFQRVGILGDVATSNEDIDPDYLLTRDFQKNKQYRDLPAVYTPEERFAWRDNLPGCIQPRVWIGHYRGPFGIDPNIIFNGSENCRFTDGEMGPPLRQMSEKRMHMAIGDLAVTISMREPPPHGRNANESFLRLDTSMEATTWPARRLVNDRDFLLLLTQDVDVLRMFRVAGDPRAAELALEEAIRSTGPFQEQVRAHRANVAVLHGFN